MRDFESSELPEPSTLAASGRLAAEFGAAKLIVPEYHDSTAVHSDEFKLLEIPSHKFGPGQGHEKAVQDLSNFGKVMPVIEVEEQDLIQFDCIL